MSTIQKAAIYTTTDGASHLSFKAAKVAQDVIDRNARVDAVIATFRSEGDAVNAYDIALRGPAFLEALTLPSGRAPRKPKAVAV
jgi:hypothetical protein